MWFLRSVGDVQGVDAFWHVCVRGWFWRREAYVLLRSHHVLRHPHPKPFTQPIAALQLQMLTDPAGPDAVDVFGVEGDFERPALEAAGS